MPLLFIDTETTGMIKWKLPPDHPSQPRMVQLAAILTDDAGESFTEFSTLIKPDGWTIEQGAADVHGIDTEQCATFGLSVVTVLSLLADLCERCEVVIAHNMDFDGKIVDGEFKRAGHAYGFDGRLRNRRTFCTMKAATPICKLAGNYGDYKWPKLIEAYRHFFNEDFEGAHDALADVRACMKCYFKLQALNEKAEV